jgi:hypothetical protein
MGKLLTSVNGVTGDDTTTRGKSESNVKVIYLLNSQLFVPMFLHEFWKNGAS